MTKRDELSKRLREHVQRHGLRQVEVAEAIGVSQPFVSRLLAGRAGPMRRSTREKLERYLDGEVARAWGASRVVDEDGETVVVAGSGGQGKSAAARDVAAWLADTDSPRRLRAPGEPIHVFVSSTYLDNAKRRARVIDAIQRSGMVPVAMERFTASGRPAAEECIRMIREEADLFVGILAWRYGSIPEGADASITELEYKAAAHLPRLMFVVDPRSPVDVEVDFDSGTDRWKLQERLDAFKRRVQTEQMATPFDEEATLGVKVMQALQEWRERHASEGPFSAPSPAEPPPAEELALDAEITEYLERLDALHDSIPLAGFETRVRVPIALEDLYVELDAMPDLRATRGADFADAEDAEVGLRGLEDLSRVPLTEAFQRFDHKSLVILGDPGSGKTTHLKRLVLWLARNGSESLGLPDDMIPVYLPLRDLGDVSRGLDYFLKRELKSPHLRLDEGFGKRLLDRGNLLFLFDGLDEVPGKERESVARYIEDARKSYPGSRFVVTCRYAGYTGGAHLDEHFLELHLRPLDTAQAEGFIENWYRIVETTLAVDRAQAETKAKEEAQALIERLREPDFRAARVFELTRNPLLLTAICLVHRDRGRLPHRRAELYQECVNVLLERWREAKRMTVSIDAKAACSVLQPMAYFLHSEEGRTKATAEELAPILEKALIAAKQDVSAADFLATIRDESGLLTGWSGDLFGFMHLGFQEYLAAREIRARHFRGEPVLKAVAKRFGESWWNEVCLLTLALDDPPLFEPLMREVLATGALAKEPELIGACLEDSVCISGAPFAEIVEGRSGLSAEELRLALGFLERADPRESRRVFPTVAGALGIERVERRTIRDNAGCELLLVPGGTFEMGEKGTRRREVTISDFYMGVAPVTNEEYGRFLAEQRGVTEPAYWSDRRYNAANQPVVGVSWEDAMAYCEWAGVKLPTEAQWEYACRGGTETQFWSGAREADLARVGWYLENSGWNLHAVREKDANPLGLYDVHGNVWEWCADWYGPYPDRDEQNPTGPRSGVSRVWRGGSFRNRASDCRAASRYGSRPTNRGFRLGFRVALPRPVRPEPATPAPRKADPDSSPDPPTAAPACTSLS